MNQLQRAICGITSKPQMLFMKDISIHFFEVEARWQAIYIHEIWKTIKQRVIHFGYPKMHLVGHISESIWRMGCGNNCTTDISEWLHIGNGKEANRTTNKINYIEQMLQYNVGCTSLDYMEETLSYLAL